MASHISSVSIIFVALLRLLILFFGAPPMLPVRKVIHRVGIPLPQKPVDLLKQIVGFRRPPDHTLPFRFTEILELGIERSITSKRQSRWFVSGDRDGTASKGIGEAGVEILPIRLTHLHPLAFNKIVVPGVR